MSLLLRLILTSIRHLFTSRDQLMLEVLALRQQLAMCRLLQPKTAGSSVQLLPLASELPFRPRSDYSEGQVENERLAFGADLSLELHRLVVRTEPIIHQDNL